MSLYHISHAYDLCNNKVCVSNQHLLPSPHAGFCQLMAVVYGSALLVVLLHIELNVLGGTMYQEVQAAERRKEGEESQSHTSDIQKRYLETVHYLIGKGVCALKNSRPLQWGTDIGPLRARQHPQVTFDL